MSLTISNLTKSELPTTLFKSILKEVLGDKFKLSLVMTSPQEIAKLNEMYRGKNEPTDILSFPLSVDEGEIYICPVEARKEAIKFDREYDNFLLFLFIHGCAHLKGYDHSAMMEELEAKVRVKFGV